MTASKDTASFFENGTTEQFEFCFKLYPEVLKLKAEKRCKKPQELIRLDEWYQNELPKLIKARGKDAHMVYDELVQTMKWKQSRGKFYPQLSYLVKVNTPRAVMQETKKAFRKLPNLEQAITALSNLKGVGTTMASALLAAAAPDSAPFMADECLMAIPEIEGIDYTTKEYLNFVHHIEATVTRLNKEAGGESPFWSPHRVELALWAHYVANDLSPELLDEMPGPGAGGGANTNGSAAKAAAKAAQAAKELDGGDDTNDGDDESLGAAVRGETNNTATESETDNENTNPIPAVMAVAAGVLQDGDSNFVSNDSTSQEPIIDDNTTQTTATTSTDEGEAGTPLASDSESNLEAPAEATHASNAAGLAGGVATVVAPLLASSNSRNNNCTNSNSDIDISDNGNNSSSSRSNRATAVEAVTASTVAVTDTLTAAGNANGNGNGTLEAPVGTVSDGENSSCLRSMGNHEEASEEDEAEAEEDDRIADENSNSHAQSHKSVTPIIGINDGTNNTADSNNDSMLGSAADGVTVAQKRALHCGADGLVDDANSQPELKKIRSD